MGFNSVFKGLRYKMLNNVVEPHNNKKWGEDNHINSTVFKNIINLVTRFLMSGRKKRNI